MRMPTVGAKKKQIRIVPSRGTSERSRWSQTPSLINKETKFTLGGIAGHETYEITRKQKC